MFPAIAASMSASLGSGVFAMSAAADSGCALRLVAPRSATLSDIDAFANRGGVIGLVMEDKAVRFAVNRTAAGEARLRISSQVLHLAVPLFSAVSPCR